MTRGLEEHAGTFVAGTPIGDTEGDYQRYVKYVTIPPEQQQSSVFEHGDPDELRHLEDPLRRSIFDALQASQQQLVFLDLAALQSEVTLRARAIEVITQLNTGQIDADYFDPQVGLHPRIDGTYYDTSSPPAPAQGHWLNGSCWSAMDFADAWSAAFQQQGGKTASQVLQEIVPFRGECAGALQIAAFSGAMAAQGDAAFDRQNDAQGLQIGPWGKDVQAYLEKVAVDAAAVPGDYFYFKNKDDYLKWAPNGFWQGLNCLYVGQDALGTRRYTGLGAVWQSEAELRATMKNAYVGDCYPHQVEDPASEIRFTVHARLVLPSAPAAAPAYGARAMPTTTAPPAAAPRPTAEQLRAAGFREHEGGVFVHDGIRLADLGRTLGFQPEHLVPTISASFDNPSHRVPLDDVHCIVDYLDPDAPRHDGSSQVRATVNLKAAVDR
jgi:hypothetical protein